jgi:hypothetical protein
LLETSLKAFCSFVPKVVTATTMAQATSEHSNAYSIAVAPDSLTRNALIRSVMISPYALGAINDRKVTGKNCQKFNIDVWPLTEKAGRRALMGNAGGPDRGNLAEGRSWARG